MVYIIEAVIVITYQAWRKAYELPLMKSDIWISFVAISISRYSSPTAYNLSNSLCRSPLEICHCHSWFLHIKTY